MVLRLLSRLLQYGHLNIASVQLALQVLPVEIARDERSLMRIVRYLVHLGLGDGAAGTPLPVPPQAGAGVRDSSCSGSWRGEGSSSYKPDGLASRWPWDEGAVV